MNIVLESLLGLEPYQDMDPDPDPFQKEDPDLYLDSDW